MSVGRSLAQACRLTLGVGAALVTGSMLVTDHVGPAIINGFLAVFWLWSWDNDRHPAPKPVEPARLREEHPSDAARSWQTVAPVIRWEQHRRNLNLRIGQKRRAMKVQAP